MKKAQNPVAGFLFFFMASVISALLMPTVREQIVVGVNSTNGTTHGILLSLFLTYWPVAFIFVSLIIFLVVIRR